MSTALRYYRWMAMRAKAKVILQSATTVRFMPKGKVMATNAVQAGYLSYTGFNGVGTKQGSSGQISVGDKATI